MRRLLVLATTALLTFPAAASARGTFDPSTEFEQHEWVPIHLGPVNMSITKAVVYLFIGAALTILLGLTFTSVQAFEYAHAPFAFKGSIYGSTFFMATGFHGFHVIIGTIFLTVCLIRAYVGQFTPTQHLGFEFAAWYWHFVDVVWLFLFICIYVWGTGGGSLAGAE